MISKGYSDNNDIINKGHNKQLQNMLKRQKVLSKNSPNESIV